MRIVYRQPKEIMNDVLFNQFQNNEYFMFSDFVHKVKGVQSKEPISSDMMKDFIYEMIDQNRIAQEYIGDNVSTGYTNEQKQAAPNKSIRFKLTGQQQ